MENPPPGPLRIVADCAVLAEDSVLLVEFPPENEWRHPEGWLLPGGSLDWLEHPDETIARLLAAQLGLEVDPEAVWLDHVESSKALDGAWLVAFHYTLEAASRPVVTPAAGVLAQWWHIDTLPNPNDVAHMGWALTTLDAVLEEEEEEEEEEG